MSEQPNQRLLDEVNGTGAWLRARKTKPIWARRVEQDATVKTREGTETIKAGDYLCRGIADELWPQSADRLQRQYNATDEVDDAGYRKYLPNPEVDGVFAARVDDSFSVVTQWGTLTGKPGDYLVKDFEEKATRYPDDVWIVDARIFIATYEFIESP